MRFRGSHECVLGGYEWLFAEGEARGFTLKPGFLSRSKPKIEKPPQEERYFLLKRVTPPSIGTPSRNITVALESYSSGGQTAEVLLHPCEERALSLLQLIPTHVVHVRGAAATRQHDGGAGGLEAGEVLESQ